MNDENHPHASVLYFLEGNALFIGTSIDTEEHTHHLVQVVLALEGNFRIKTDGPWETHHAVMLDADVPHSFDGTGGCQAFLLFDAQSRRARAIRHVLASRTRPVPFDIPGDASFVSALHLMHREPLPAFQVKAVISDALEFITGEAVEVPPMDPRIMAMLRDINGNPAADTPAQKYATRWGLSESRMLHLFSEYTGIPFRHYRLWARLRHAVSHITQGMPFTDAAIMSGFSDSSHLSRTFKRMFGVTLLDIFKNYKNSRFIQVITDTD